MTIDYTLDPLDRMVLRVLHYIGTTSHDALKVIVDALPSDAVDLQEIVVRLAESLTTTTDDEKTRRSIEDGKYARKHWIDIHFTTLQQLQLITRSYEPCRRLASGSVDWWSDRKDHSQGYILTDKAKRSPSGSTRVGGSWSARRFQKGR